MNTIASRRLAVAAISLSLAAALFAAPAASAAGYGWNISMSASEYAPKQTVEFCLVNNSRIPFFYGPDERPWRIVDAESGGVVYQPPSTPPTTQPEARFGKICDSWDQKNSRGHRVKAGDYRLEYLNTAFNVEPASFAISHPRDRASDRGTSGDAPGRARAR